MANAPPLRWRTSVPSNGNVIATPKSGEKQKKKKKTDTTLQGGNWNFAKITTKKNRFYFRLLQLDVAPPHWGGGEKTIYIRLMGISRIRNAFDRWHTRAVQCNRFFPSFPYYNHCVRSATYVFDGTLTRVVRLKVPFDDALHRNRAAKKICI